MFIRGSGGNNGTVEHNKNLHPKMDVGPTP
jgi:hypothetical protein